MSSKYSIDRDLKEAVAMAEALDDYVRDDTLYGHVQGGMFGSGNMPSLTIGALLMRLRRLHALSGEMTASQQADLDHATQLHEAAMNNWRVHYENKLLREATSRLDAMRTFFGECQDNPDLCANIYRPEALRRTIVHEITLMMQEMGVVSAKVDEKIIATDRMLRQVLRPASFLWDEGLESLYPLQSYWWLHQSPPSS